MSVQSVIFLICILVALAGAFVAGVSKAWVAALALLAFAAFVLGYAWPVFAA